MTFLFLFSTSCQTDFGNRIEVDRTIFFYVLLMLLLPSLLLLLLLLLLLFFFFLFFFSFYRLVSPVVKASAPGAEDPEFDFRLRRGDFSWSSHISDLKIDTPVATLPGAWRMALWDRRWDWLARCQYIVTG